MNRINIFAFSLALVALCNLSHAASKRMPSISTLSTGGEAFRLDASAITKPTLIVFWATWCASCRHEIPALKALYKEHSTDVDIIAISVDDNVKKVANFVKQADISYTSLVDPKGEIADAFGMTQTPSLFVVDAKGQIIKEGSRVDDVKSTLLELAEKPKVAATSSITRDAVVMGTEFSAVILSNDKQKAEAAIDAALAEIKRVEDLMTDWRKSELMKINEQAGKKPVKLDSEIIALLSEARQASDATQGVFDVTYAPLGALWDYTKPNPIPPSPAQIKKALTLVNYRDLQIDTKNNTAFLKKAGMRVGLGGIAKGYAVGRAAQIIKNLGFENFALRAGGDMAVHGTNDGKLWQVAVRDPRDKTKNFAMIPISNGAVSTSGDYERFFTHKGKRYAHIIDTRTGYPADKCQSVTIITKRSVWADVLSKSVFIMGPEEGMKFIKKQTGVEGVIVDARGRVTVSPGLERPAPHS